MRWVHVVDVMLQQVRLCETDTDRCDLLLRYDDDWGVQVHLYVDRLVCLQSILKPGSGFLAYAFQRLPRYVLFIKRISAISRLTLSY